MYSICARCQHSNPEGAKYCENCGFPVLVAHGTSTTEIPTMKAPTSNQTETTRKPTPFPKDGQLTLEIDGKQIQISVSSRLVLGRKTPESSPSVVDLTPFASYQRGVSRNHAVIELVDDNHLTIIDLASVNGTFVNDQRLQPRTVYPLQDGDKVKLGELKITLRYPSSS